MNVVLLINTSRMYGGGEVITYSLACGLRDKGYRPMVVVHEGGVLHQRLEAQGIKTLPSRFSKWSAFNPAARWHIWALLKRYRPSVALLNGPEELKLLSLLPYRGVRLIYVRAHFSPVRPTIYNRLMFRGLHAVVVPSSYVQRNSLSDILRACPVAVKVIPNGVPRSLLSFNPAKQEPKKLLCVGRLSPEKNIEVLLQALALLRTAADWQLTILGDGPEKSSLQALALALGLENKVSFAGFVSDLSAYYAKAYCLVHPARREAFGNIFVEAMSHALPSIGFAGHGADDIIAHGRTGLLVGDFSPAALAEAIDDMLSHPDKAAAMGEAARALYCDRFTIEHMVDQYCALIDADD